MGLADYRRKRDFARTPEPEPRLGAKGRGGGVFIVQKHDATNLHFDFRLEMDGVLRSWAVPKGPGLAAGEKRLAVHVEDHPLGYGTFEGTIPRGQYGGGTVMLWDRGAWTPDGDAAEGYRTGKLKFRLDGERLRGRWMLIRTRGRGTAAGSVATGSGKEPWLLLKERDEEAGTGVTVESFTTSVATGRTMAEIAAGKAARRSLPKRKGARAKTATALGASAAPMPKDLRPQLATLALEAPSGPGWLHEVKLDGYRLLAFRKAGEVRLVSRTGRDWTARMPLLAAAIGARLGVDVVLDGEAVMFDARGVSDFQALQNSIKGRRAGSIVFVAFDLPWLDGADLTALPLGARRDKLAALIGKSQSGPLRLSEHVEADGPRVLEKARALGLEGIVSKRVGSRYTSGRSDSWRKVKCLNMQDLVVGGFTPPEGGRSDLGALLLGYYDDGGSLVYAGRVGTGFSSETLRRLGVELRGRVRATPPFAGMLPANAQAATWVRPDLVAVVAFREWTTDGVLRQPVFHGLRDDVDPRQVRRELLPVVAPAAIGARPRREATPAPVPAKGRRGAERTNPRLTHPERVVFPDRGAGFAVTKAQLAAYYEAVADLMLPHIAGRPLSIVRCPAGEGGKCFFQKHRAAGMPDAVRTTTIKNDDGIEAHLMIDNAAGLLGLVQMNALEIHPWGARADLPDRPDRLVFDFDPGPGVRWREVVEAALILRDALDDVRLAAFVRTTGGKGLHVVVPIHRRYSWERAAAFAKAVADTFVRLSPQRFVSVSTKARREGRIYIDHLRNARGATAVASYSTRARPGAPVAAPLFWEELTADLHPAAFSVVSVPRRLAGISGDPWAGLTAAAASLPAG